MTEDEQRQMVEQMQAAQANTQSAAVVEPEATPEGFDENDQSSWGNPSRNDECPCGSGKKFKHCHGQVA